MKETEQKSLNDALSSFLKRPLEGQVLKVKKGRMEQDFNAPYTKIIYNIALWIITATHFQTECHTLQQTATYFILGPHLMSVRLQTFVIVHWTKQHRKAAPLCDFR